MLVVHILSAKLKSSWPCRKMDRVYDNGSEDFRLETCRGFLFLTEEFNKETVVVQHTSR